MVAVDWTGPLQTVKGGRVTMKSGCFHTYFCILLEIGYFLPLVVTIYGESTVSGSRGQR